jgi:DNA-directed RNA polymerase subunit RPC12/RpoP
MLVQCLTCQSWIAVKEEINEMLTIDQDDLTGRVQLLHDDYNALTFDDPERFNEDLCVGNDFDEEYGMRIKHKTEHVKCPKCASEYAIAKEVRLEQINVPYEKNKSWIPEEIQEEAYGENFDSSEDENCVHNFVFQRKISGTNEAEVKCSKCGQYRTM